MRIGRSSKSAKVKPTSNSILSGDVNENVERLMNELGHSSDLSINNISQWLAEKIIMGPRCFH